MEHLSVVGLEGMAFIPLMDGLLDVVAQTHIGSATVVLALATVNSFRGLGNLTIILAESASNGYIRIETSRCRGKK